MRVAILPGVGLALFLAACNAGEGHGVVQSDHLYVKDCWDGPFDLRPTFFATIPFEDSQQIRIQRGERALAVSDGISLVVSQVAHLRTDQIDQAIRLGLPAGINPPGFPARVEPEPLEVSLTLYLFDTCHAQNGALYSVDGTITFSSLFSGDRNENDAKDRLTSATFSATVVDPRDAELTADAATGQLVATYPDDRTSTVHGRFEFFFQRGVPAQPFP